MDNLRFKFRGKRVDNGVWVYGFYFKEAIENEDKQGFDYLSFIKSEYGDHYKDYEVIPETVGQYTGLKDKNGKEDYVGNIWAVYFEGKRYLFERTVDEDWNGYCFGWECLNGELSPVHAGLPEDGEVIGNIHENIDLLK